jgi:CDP-diacylglycerol--glycerol-3-phosphate 3-phosphatidyltransferase
MQGKFWTISNTLSLSRIFLMAPVIYFFLTPIVHNREYAVLFILLAVITDALDGYFARLLRQESEIGKIIDPLADKIGVGTVVVLLLFFGDISFWFAVIVILRDVLIFIGGLILKVRKGIILPSNLPGKFAVAFVAFTLVFAMMRYHFFSLLMQFSLFVSVVLLLFSFALYIKRFYTVMKSSPDINSSSQKADSQ